MSRVDGEWWCGARMPRIVTRRAAARIVATARMTHASCGGRGADSIRAIEASR